MLVKNLRQVVEEKIKDVKEIEELCSVKSEELNQLMEEKEKNQQKHYRELNAIQERTMSHIQKIVDDHEKLKRLLESERKKLEIKCNELAKREVHNGTERMKLSEDLEQVSIYSLYLSFQDICSRNNWFFSLIRMHLRIALLN